LANELKRSKRICTNKISQENINPKNLDFLKKYKRDMEMRGLSKTSIYSYECDLIHWMSYLVEVQMNALVIDVNEEDIEEFIYYCKEQGNNTERIKRRTSSISAFYKFLRKKKEVKENPLEFIARPKRGLPVVVQTYLSPEQFMLMKEKLEEYGDTQLQAYCILGVDTMARVTAMSNITWEQIDFDDRTISDVLEKEGKIVTLYFDDYSKELLLKLKEERLKEKINSEYVFIVKAGEGYINASAGVLHDWCKKVGQMIGIPSLHCHDLRHSGSQLRKLAGMPIEDISGFLNHSGIDVTRKFYLKDDKKSRQNIKDKYKI